MAKSISADKRENEKKRLARRAEKLKGKRKRLNNPLMLNLKMRFRNIVRISFSSI